MKPDITDDQIAFSIGEMKSTVSSIPAIRSSSAGAMTDARWKDFFDKMVETRMVAASADYKAHTLQFVGGGVGLNPSSVIASRRSAMSRPLIIICPATRRLACCVAGLDGPAGDADRRRQARSVIEPVSGGRAMSVCSSHCTPRSTA